MTGVCDEPARSSCIAWPGPRVGTERGVPDGHVLLAAFRHPVSGVAQPPVTGGLDRAELLGGRAGEWVPAPLAVFLQPTRRTRAWRCQLGGPLGWGGRGAAGRRCCRGHCSRVEVGDDDGVVAARVDGVVVEVVDVLDGPMRGDPDRV